MNKNVLIVLIVILTPIVVVGIIAVAGAEHFEKQKEAAENSQNGEGANESAGVLVPMQVFDTIHAYSSDLIGSGASMALS